MLREENDKLKTAYQVSKIHWERMRYAYRKIEPFFPLNTERYATIDNDTLSYFDQFVYRFSKLQDSLGAKLFKSILDSLGEETRGVPFIDILSRLEALGILDSADEWLLLREIRNNLAHEYSLDKQEIADGLNLLYEHYGILSNIWNKTEGYILKKFG